MYFGGGAVRTLLYVAPPGGSAPNPKYKRNGVLGALGSAGLLKKPALYCLQLEAGKRY